MNVIEKKLKGFFKKKKIFSMGKVFFGRHHMSSYEKKTKELLTVGQN